MGLQRAMSTKRNAAESATGRQGTLERRCKCGQHWSDLTCRACEGAGVHLEAMSAAARDGVSRPGFHTGQVLNDAPDLAEPRESRPSGTSPSATGRRTGGSSRATCRPPESVQLASTTRLELSGYATGGGICALMNVRPDVEGLCSPIAEEVTQGDKGTCPGSLITGGLCQGSSDFPLGRRQGGACRDIEPSATQFVDRHSTQLKNVSILHEADRNPKSLNQCQQTCDQRYFFRSADKEVELGRFQIVYDYRKRPGTGVVATDVTVTKTARR